MFLSSKEKECMDDSLKWAKDNEVDGHKDVSQAKIKNFYSNLANNRRNLLFVISFTVIAFSCFIYL